MKALVLMALLSAQPSAVETQLKSRYANWDASYRAHDVKALAHMLHPKFRIITLSGKTIDRAAYVKSLCKGTAPEKYRTTLLRAERRRLTAFALTEEISQEWGKPEHIHRYRDTWSLVEGRWLLLESKTLEER